MNQDNSGGSTEAQDYKVFLNQVLQQPKDSGQAVDMPSIFHHVRRIPYGGAGQRDPRKVYELNLGTCSGKHILLRDLLRAAGFNAQVVTVFTFFNKGIPVDASMNPELQRIIQQTDVPDYHNFVQVQTTDIGWLTLDATWHDALKPLGFPVNDAWNGVGVMSLAGAALKIYPAAEDVVTLKKSLLDTLKPAELQLRARFLELLTEWMATK